MNNYKRLTKYSEENQDYITPFCDTANCNGVCVDCDYEQVIINRLAELEDKIENGTLIMIPCKVGDTVFIIEGGIIEGYEVLGVLVQFEELFFKILRKRDCSCKLLGIRSVFLTKAEAEAKLKELRGE